MRRQTTAKSHLLREIPGLEDASRRDLAAIERSLDDVELRSGTVLVRAGAVARQAFIVFDEHGAHFVGFHELRGGRPATATVIAERPARALVAGPGSFAQLMQSPSFCAAAFSDAPAAPRSSTAMVVAPA